MNLSLRALALALGLCGFVLTSADAQVVIRWERTLGTPLYDAPGAIAPLDRGGFLVAGATSEAESGPVVSWWVAEVDADGSVGPRREIPGGLDRGGEVLDVVPKADGSFALARTGTPQFYGQTQAVVVMADSGGEVLWEQRLGPGANCPTSLCNERLETIAPTPDGGYVAGGSVFSPGMAMEGRTEDFIPMDGWLVKLGAGGAVEWQRAYGGGSPDAIRDVVPTSDGGYAFAGTNYEGPGPGSWTNPSALWVAKVDEAGRPLWERLLWPGVYPDDAGAASIVETADGGLLAGGRCGRGLCLARFTAAGDTAWTYQAPGRGYDIGALRIAPMDGGRYAVLGDRGSAPPFPSDRPWKPQFRSWVLVIDDAGQVERQRTVGAAPLGTSTGADAPVDLAVGADGTLGLLVQISRAANDVTEHLGGADVWVTSLYSDFTPVASDGEPPGAAALGLGVGPNPASGWIRVRYALPAPGHVRLALYDALGREVAVLTEGARAEGSHEATLPAGRLSPGVYLLRLASGGAVATRRLTVAR